ncbi:hypothetical protein C8Q76DRAFT_693960 [Earliella scabrosa]|nr:hypothetical protein C8Q76DRAFT_693960 [Earliella scabrosa]
MDNHLNCANEAEVSREPTEYLEAKDELSHDTVWKLAAYRPVMVLLPRLVTLVWSSCNQFIGIPDEDLPVVLSFIGPTLRTFRAFEWEAPPNDDSERYLESSLSRITHHFHRLEDFNLDHLGQVAPHGHPHIHTSLLRMAQGLSYLRTFSLMGIPLTEDTLIALGELPALFRLEVELCTSTWLPAMPMLSFPSLRVLQIVTNTRDYVAFSRFTTLPTVTTVELSVKQLPIHDDIPHLIKALREQFSPLNLTRLSLTFNYASEHMAEVPVIDPAYRGFYLDTARALPQLTSINLATSHLCRHDVLPEIDALAPFALYCPNLENLGLCFDATRAISIAEVEALLPHASSSRIHTLQVGRSPIVSPEVAAACLARLLPSLKEINTGYMVTTQQLAWSAGWEKAQTLLPWFEMIRRDGRNGGQSRADAAHMMHACHQDLQIMEENTVVESAYDIFGRLSISTGRSCSKSTRRAATIYL